MIDCIWFANNDKAEGDESMKGAENMNVIKKIMVMIISLTVWMLSLGTLFAMSLSQPEKVGSIVYANMGGFLIRGATFNQEKESHQRKGHIVYDTGMAKYSDGVDALYFHYDNYRWGKNDMSPYYGYTKFGDKNINNTVQVDIMHPIVFKIKSNENITMYVVKDSYDLPWEDSYTVIGRRSDGKWVKYIDTVEVAKNYLGTGYYGFGAMAVDGDVIRIFYELYEGLSTSVAIEEGEFRFKWDEAAQWFGVERVVYNTENKNVEKCIPSEAVEYNGHYYYLYDG